MNAASISATSDSIEQVLNDLKSDNWALRYNAVFRLKNIRESNIDIKSIVVQLLKDPHPPIRALVIQIYLEELDIASNILELTYDPDPTVRFFAISAIWQILEKNIQKEGKRDSDLIDAIGSMKFEHKKTFLFNTLAALANDKRSEKEKLKYILTEIQNQLPDEIYYSIIEEKKEDIKLLAMTILASRNDYSKFNPKLIEIAIKNLYDEKFEIVQLCLEIIKRSKYEQSINLIIPLVCSYNIAIRIEALKILEALNPERFHLVDHQNFFLILSKDERRLILEYLHTYLNKEKGITEKEFQSRILHVLSCMEKLNSELAIPTIRYLIQDKQSIIRDKAVELFCQLGFPEYQNEIFEMLKSPHFGVFNTVIRFLKQLEPKIFIIPLIHFYKQNMHQLLERDVANFIGSIFDKLNIEVEIINSLENLDVTELVKKWKDADDSIRKYYESILIYYGDPAILYLGHIKQKIGNTDSELSEKIDRLIEKIEAMNPNGSNDAEIIL